MVLEIVFPFRDLPTRKEYIFYNFYERIIMMTTYLLLRLLINSNVLYIRRQWENMTTLYTYLIYNTIGKYTIKCDTLKLHNKTCSFIPKGGSTLHKAQGKNHGARSSWLFIPVKTIRTWGRSHPCWIMSTNFPSGIMVCS